MTNTEASPPINVKTQPQIEVKLTRLQYVGFRTLCIIGQTCQGNDVEQELLKALVEEPAKTREDTMNLMTAIGEEAERILDDDFLDPIVRLK